MTENQENHPFSDKVYYNPISYSEEEQQQYEMERQEYEKKSNQSKDFSTTSLIFGILAILSLCCCNALAFVFAILAVIFGFLSKMKDEPFSGSSIAGLILGAVCLIWQIGWTIISVFVYVMEIVSVLLDYV